MHYQKAKIYTPQKPMELMLAHNVKSMSGRNTSLLNYENKIILFNLFKLYCITMPAYAALESWHKEASKK